jgi:hypothetical protein
VAYKTTLGVKALYPFSMPLARIRDIKHFPFSVFKRTGRRFYSVKLKNNEIGEYLSAVSTRQETETGAIVKAFR